MGERDGFEPGAFCWVDLSTSDPDAAKQFYSGLFGWEAEDMPVDGGGVYSMQSLGGKQVAAIAAQPPQQAEAGVPPLWNNYVWADSADEVADKAKGLGADVHAPPFDVMQAGRMAVLADPQGAFFMLWQPNEHKGAELVNAPGALVWNELGSPDFDASTAFYSGLFGWEISPFEGSPMPYLSIMLGDARAGGIRQLQDGEPPNWLAYFGTDDIDAALAKVTELGGTKMAGPIDIGVGKIGIVQDPQGATFALFAGGFDD